MNHLYRMRKSRVYTRTYPNDNDNEVSAELWTPLWSGDNNVQNTRSHNKITRYYHVKRKWKLNEKSQKKVEMSCLILEIIIKLINWDPSIVQQR